MVERRMVPVVRNHLPQDPLTTSRKLWESLHNLYARTDVASQFQLKARVASFKLKDSSEVDKYLSDFASACQKFKAMDVEYTEAEAVYGLIHGLPSSNSWESFKQLLIQTVQHYEDTTESDKRVANALYNRISQRIVAECMCLDLLPSRTSKEKIPQDYASITDEIRKHAKNPCGI
jgi:gag-polypeptide of LTR copia-type